jgi:hypothetical protein
LKVEKEEKRIITQAVKNTPHINLRKTSHLDTRYHKTPPPKYKERSMGIRRVACLT